MEPLLVNGKAHYKKGGYAIWYAGGKWQIGNLKALGKTRGFAYYYTSDECPYETHHSWRYHNNVPDEWYDADTSLLVRERSL